MKKLYFTFLVSVFLLFLNALLLAQWNQTNGPYGGNITVLSAGGNKLAALTSEAGPFLSTDSGQNWNPINNGPLTRWVSSLLIKGDTIFAGDNGLFISTDNGTNWTKNKNGISIYNHINVLVESGDILFAGTDSGLYRSTDNGAKWTQIDIGVPDVMVRSIDVHDTTVVLAADAGVFISRNDGLTWKLSVIGLPVQSPHSAVIHGNNIFTTVFNSAKNTYMIYGSADFGLTWQETNNGLPDDALIYSLISSDNTLLAGTADKGVFRSTDNAINWTAAVNGLPAEASINNLTSSGNNIFASVKGSGIFLSTDGGASWTSSNNGLSGFLITSYAAKSDSIFIGTAYCGVHFSDDNGVSWKSLNIPNYTNYYIAGFAFDSKNIYINTTTDGIIRSSDNGLNWKVINNGIANPNGNITNIMVHKNRLFAIVTNSPGQKGWVYYSTDSGDQWLKVSSGSIDFSGTYSLTSNGTNIFAALPSGVYVSKDDGLNWETSENGLNGKMITRLKAKSNAVFAAAYVGDVFKSTNNGADWFAVNNGLPGNMVSSFEFSGDSAVFAGIEDTGIYLSLDDGLNWKPVTLNLPHKNPNMFYNFFRDLVICGKYIYTETITTLWRRLLTEMIPLLPEIPKPDSVKNNSIDQPLDLTLTWRRSNNADSYQLQLAKDSMFIDILLNDSALTSLSENITGLSEGQRYYWRLRAGNSSGLSPWSEKWNFTTILFAPENLNLKVIGETKVELSWTDKSKAEKGFIIERKQSLDFQVLDSVGSNTVSYIDSTVKQLSEYQYRVKAYSNYASSHYSNITSVIPTEVLMQNSVPVEYSLLQNYPNPFNPATIITYGLPKESSVKVNIYNLIGEIVKELNLPVQSAGFHQFNFDASGLSSGIYFYALEARAIDGSKSFREIKKMIVLK